MTELRNESMREFESIEGETRRVYNFGEEGEVVIDSPMELHMSSHGHYIFDAEEVMHYVPYGWIELRFEVNEDTPHIWL